MPFSLSFSSSSLTHALPIATIFITASSQLSDEPMTAKMISSVRRITWIIFLVWKVLNYGWCYPKFMTGDICWRKYEVHGRSRMYLERKLYRDSDIFIYTTHTLIYIHTYMYMYLHTSVHRQIWACACKLCGVNRPPQDCMVNHIYM